MFHYVYCIENLINGKVYVGKHSTEDLDDGYMGSGTRIRHAIAKHGLENFRRHILKDDFASSEEALEFEKLLVTKEFISDENTYNLNEGGHGSFTACNKFFAENSNLRKEKNKRAAQAMNATLWADQTWRKNASNRAKELFERLHSEGKIRRFDWTGHKHKEETKRKIGEANAIAQKGESNSQFGTCWVHNLVEFRNTKINKNDLDAYLKLGWMKGRKMKW